MTYLFVQMFLYLLIAFLLGWLIWRYEQPSSSEIDTMRS